MARNSSTGSRVWKVILSLLVALLVLLLLTELGLRWFIAGQIRDGFHQETQEQGVTSPEDPEVTFGATPLVVGLVQGRLPQVSITAPATFQITGTEVRGTPAAHVRIEDLRLSQDNPVAGTLSTTTELPDAYLLAVVKQQINQQSFDGIIGDFLGDNLVTGVQADPAAGAINVEFGQGIGSMSLTPEMTEGQLFFRVGQTQLFGFDLPAEVSEGITYALQEGIQIGVSGEVASDGTLTVEEFSVIEGGVRATVSGTNIPLQDISVSGGALPAR